MAGSETPLVLPPGTDLAQFQAYISRAREIVGAENVTIVTGEHDLAKTDYMDPATEHDMFYLFDKDYFVASATLCPRKVLEVQAIMKLNNEFKIPVWPFSIGRNIGYGGAAPRVPGSVGINMGQNMNRVLEINEQNAYCLVEPGVTYKELYEELRRRGLEDKLWIDVPDLGGGSVLGNAMERGVGYSPYGDHFTMHSGMEVVLPNGELMRTGMGAMPHPHADKNAPLDEQQPNSTWQLFPYGFGPYHDGIFSQSNYGVITKLGLWLMPNPGGYQSYCYSFEHEDDLPAIVEAIRKLRIPNIIMNVPTIRHILIDAACLGPKKSYYDIDRPLNEEELVAIQKKLKLGRWNFYAALYGPDVMREAQWQVISATFGSIPGSKGRRYEEGKEHPGVMDIRHLTQKGVPTFDELAWVNWLPNGAHLFFSPIAEVTGDQASKQYRITKKRMLEFGFDVITNFCVGWREMHHIVCLVYDRKDADQRRRAHGLICALIDDCAKEGWGEYRTHLALMDQVASTYSFNDNALLKFSEKLKDTIDPNGILAPGKNGVWPSGYNKSEWRLDVSSASNRKQ